MKIYTTRRALFGKAILQLNGKDIDYREGMRLLDADVSRPEIPITARPESIAPAQATGVGVSSPTLRPRI